MQLAGWRPLVLQMWCRWGSVYAAVTSSVIGWSVPLVAHSLGSPVEGGEVDAVGLVGDQQVEYGQDEGETGRLAGEATHHPGAALALAK